MCVYDKGEREIQNKSVLFGLKVIMKVAIGTLLIARKGTKFQTILVGILIKYKD